MEIAGLALVLVLAGMTKGVTGIGMPVVGIPLLSAFVNIKQAISLITIPLVLTNVAQAIEGDGTKTIVRKLILPLVSFVPGCFLGFHVLFGANEHLAKATAGLMLIAAAAVTLLAKRGERFWATRFTHPVGIGAGFAAGVIAGLSGVAGPPVFLYLLGFNPTPKEFTKSVAIFLLAANGIMALLLFRIAQTGQAEILHSLLATIPSFFGLWIGQAIRDRMPVSAFRVLALGFVFAAGAQLTYSGGVGLYAAGNQAESA